MNSAVVAIEGVEIFLKLQPDQSVEAVLQSMDIELRWDPALELWRTERAHLVLLVDCLNGLGYHPQISTDHDPQTTWAREMFNSMGTTQLKCDAHLALLLGLRGSTEETEHLEHLINEALAFELYGDKFL